MPTHQTLTIDIHSFWHAGSGRSAGALADALVQKTANDLPMVGGRHLKGLLRHAVHKAETLDWFDDAKLPKGPADSLETLLFGSQSQAEGRFETLPGLLVVTDGTLPASDAEWLAHSEQADKRQYLYQRLSSTAINEQGTAVDGSLRTLEVAIPVQLKSELSMKLTAADDTHREQQQAWLKRNDAWQPLEVACSLVDSLGASRTRGLGEARLSLTCPTQESQS